MKNLKLLAALLALTIGLAGCGGSSKGSSASSSKPEKMLDGDNMTASPSAKQEYTEPENVTYMRLLAGEERIPRLCAVSGRLLRGDHRCAEGAGQPDRSAGSVGLRL